MSLVYSTKKFNLTLEGLEARRAANVKKRGMKYNMTPEGLEAKRAAGLKRRGKKLNLSLEGLEAKRAAGLKRRGMKYNMTPEGLEAKRAAGLKRRGKKCSPEGLENIRAAGLKRRGMKYSVSPEALANIRAANAKRRGKKCSPETRAKLSASVSKAILEGRFRPEGHGRGGHFYSNKNRKTLHYRSQLELHWYQFLEKLEKVVSYKVEPFTIPYSWNGTIHLYHPDLLIEYQDKSLELVEIKPEGKLRDDPQTQAKLEAGWKWCSGCRRKVDFRIVGSDELQWKRASS